MAGQLLGTCESILCCSAAANIGRHTKVKAKPKQQLAFLSQQTYRDFEDSGRADNFAVPRAATVATGSQGVPPRDSTVSADPPRRRTSGQLRSGQATGDPDYVKYREQPMDPKLYAPLTEVATDTRSFNST